MRAKARVYVILMAFVVGALPLQAASSPPKPVIASAVIDADTGTLLLRGFNFPAHPKVYLGKDGSEMDLLQIRNSSLNMIEAMLKTPPSGLYRIAVLDRGEDVKEPSTFVPHSLPASSPVLNKALMYVVRFE